MYVYYVIFIIPINVYLKYLDLAYGVILSIFTFCTPSPNSYVEVLIPSISICDFIRE